MTVNLPSRALVRVDIFSVTGSRVRTLVQGERGTGLHGFAWNGLDLNNRAVAAGVYVCRVMAGKRVISQKFIVTR
jgi:flagellar hook assembly protein FlgD